MSYGVLTAAEMVLGRETRTIFNFEWPEFLKRRGTGVASGLTKTLPFEHNIVMISYFSRVLTAMHNYSMHKCSESVMLLAYL